MTTYLKNFVDSAPHCGPAVAQDQHAAFVGSTTSPYVQKSTLGPACLALRRGSVTSLANGRQELTGPVVALSVHHTAGCCEVLAQARSPRPQARSCCRRSCRPALRGSASSTLRRSGCRRRAQPLSRRGCSSSSRWGQLNGILLRPEGCHPKSVCLMLLQRCGQRTLSCLYEKHARRQSAVSP